MARKIMTVLASCISLASFAQESPWQFSAGYGTSYSKGTIGGQQEQRVHAGSVLRTHSHFSQQWSLNTEKTELRPVENFLYHSRFFFSAERKVRPRLYLSTGLDIGGRYFDIIEYATVNYREQSPIYDGIYANKASRAFLVTSIPLQVKYTFIERSFLAWRLNTGLALNYAHAAKSQSRFYTANEIAPFYATWLAGIEVKERKTGHFSLELGVQLGFKNILNDQITVLSSIHMNRQPDVYAVVSKGSHLYGALRYYIQGRRPEKTSTATVRTVVPSSYLSRKVSQVEVIEVKEGRVELCFSDQFTADGDSISILQDDRFLSEGLLLERKEACFAVLIPEGLDETEITIVALNDGKIKPNTLKISVRQRGADSTSLIVKTQTTHLVKILIKRKTQ